MSPCLRSRNRERARVQVRSKTKWCNLVTLGNFERPVDFALTPWTRESLPRVLSSGSSECSATRRPSLRSRARPSRWNIQEQSAYKKPPIKWCKGATGEAFERKKEKNGKKREKKRIKKKKKEENTRALFARFASIGVICFLRTSRLELWKLSGLNRELIPTRVHVCTHVDEYGVYLPSSSLRNYTHNYEVSKEVSSTTNGTEFATR